MNDIYKAPQSNPIPKNIFLSKVKKSKWSPVKEEYDNIKYQENTLVFDRIYEVNKTKFNLFFIFLYSLLFIILDLKMIIFSGLGLVLLYFFNNLIERKQYVGIHIHNNPLYFNSPNQFTWFALKQNQIKKLSIKFFIYENIKQITISDSSIKPFTTKSIWEKELHIITQEDPIESLYSGIQSFVIPSLNKKFKLENCSMYFIVQYTDQYDKEYLEHYYVNVPQNVPQESQADVLTKMTKEI